MNRKQGSGRRGTAQLEPQAERGRRSWFALSSGLATAERFLGAPGRSRTPVRGRHLEFTWPPAPGSRSQLPLPERDSAGLERGGV